MNKLEARFVFLAAAAFVWSAAPSAHAQSPVDDPALHGAIDIH